MKDCQPTLSEIAADKMSPRKILAGAAGKPTSTKEADSGKKGNSTS